MPNGGLNAENLEQLRSWGAGLQRDPREEVAAAGRAISLLIEEVERLHVLVWDRRLFPDAAPAGLEGEPEAGEQELHTSLARRLRRLGRLERPAPAPQAESARDIGFHR